MSARKRVEDAIENWNGIDEVLRQIGQMERQIKQAEAAMQEAIAQAKAAAKERVKQLQGQIKLLDLQMAAFCQERREDLGKKKSRVLNFGKVGFQFSTKITVPQKKEAVAAVVARLKELKLKSCILMKESPIKNEIKKLPPTTLKQLEAVGVVKKEGDTFYHEVFQEKIMEVT